MIFYEQTLWGTPQIKFGLRTNNNGSASGKINTNSCIWMQVEPKTKSKFSVHVQMSNATKLFEHSVHNVKGCKETATKLHQFQLLFGIQIIHIYCWYKPNNNIFQRTPNKFHSFNSFHESESCWLMLYIEQFYVGPIKFQSYLTDRDINNFIAGCRLNIQ